MGCGKSTAVAKDKNGQKPSDKESKPKTDDPSPRKVSQTLTKEKSGGAVGQTSSSKCIMTHYQMSMLKEDLMGEGTSSICRKGTDTRNGDAVAIKVYKKGSGKDAGGKDAAVTLLKFKRQIEVLKDLVKPIEMPKDTTLWCEPLAKAHPSSLFIQLIDYSKDSQGEPGPDHEDGVLYVITELAQYSLKDYLQLRREQLRPLSRTSIQNISKAIVLVMAGLHAKGLVHIDLKPENMMMFNARLKLIDVDGCVKAGTKVSINDSSISFSPCYCAPEWAKFLIEEEDSRIEVQPHIDVWSVGMTLCELVTLDAILKPMYANFLKKGHSNREAGFLFMEWLSSITSPPLPRAVEKFDPEFLKLIKDGLCVCNLKQRKTLAQCLNFPYIVQGEANQPGGKEGGSSDNTVAVEEGNAVKRRFNEDTTTQEPIYKGTLYRLNADGNPANLEHWLKRDMWVAANGSLCYYSLKDNKRLVYLEQSRVAAAKVSDIDGQARGKHAFMVKVPAQGDKEALVASFACESAEELAAWKAGIGKVAEMELQFEVENMKFNEEMVKDLKAFRLAVKNRRMAIKDSDKAKFEPVFKAMLWKVKQDGDRMKESDWFEREMWISVNRSLVYYSKKEEKNLVYYTADDLKRATLKKLANNESFRPWTFQVCRAPVNGMEFDPGEFAAPSEADMETWLREFEKIAK